MCTVLEKFLENINNTTEKKIPQVRKKKVKRWEWLGHIWRPNEGDACVVMCDDWCKGKCVKVDRKLGIQVLLDGEKECADSKRYKFGDTDRIRPPKPDVCEGYVSVVRVTFDGWSSKYDEDFDVNSEKLALLHTYTVDSNDLSSKTAAVTTAAAQSNKRSFFSRLIFGSEGNNDMSSYNVGGGAAVGLSNLGNTCYMNAILQCLSHTPIFREFLISNRYEDEINRSNKRGTRGKLTKELSNVFRKLCLCESSSFRPANLKSTIGDIFPQFRGYEQQDAQELLCCVLDKIHEDVNHVSPLAEKKKKERLRKEKEEREKNEKEDVEREKKEDGDESKTSDKRLVLSERDMFERDEKEV